MTQGLCCAGDAGARVCRELFYASFVISITEHPSRLRPPQAATAPETLGKRGHSMEELSRGFRRATMMGQGQAGQAWGADDTGGLPLQRQVPAGAMEFSVHGVGLSPAGPGGTGGPADTHTHVAGKPPEEWHQSSRGKRGCCEGWGRRREPGRGWGKWRRMGVMGMMGMRTALGAVPGEAPVPVPAPPVTPPAVFMGKQAAAERWPEPCCAVPCCAPPCRALPCRIGRSRTMVPGATAAPA